MRYGREKVASGFRWGCASGVWAREFGRVLTSVVTRKDPARQTRRGEK